MKIIHYILIYLIACLVLLIVSIYQDTPGYMDAEYYYATGLQLVNDAGLQEPFVWNYLDNPQGIPHPSHGYWMPMASFLVALGSFLPGDPTFEVVRWVFILLASVSAPISGLVARSFGARPRGELLACGLAVFPGFYLAYLATTDTFGIYMLLGGLWCLVCAFYSAPEQDKNQRKLILAFVLGLIAGVMHLSRADGFVWFGASMFVGVLVVIRDRKPKDDKSSRYVLRLLGRVALFLTTIASGYLMIMGLWLYRNVQVFGVPLSPGGTLGMWFIDYDDLYIFPRSEITFQRWISSGIREILLVRWWAIKLNIQSAIIVQGGIFLWPLSVIGAWKLRRRIEVIGLGAAWITTFSLMTILFPFAGARGGFFHSGAAFQVPIWALVPIGLTEFIDWGTKLRGWNREMAYSVFSSGIVLITLVMMAFIAFGRVIGFGGDAPVWGSGFRSYVNLDSYLESISADPGDIVMVNNPPGFHLASGRPAIAIPDGDESMLLAAGKRYAAEYVILEKNHPAGLEELYKHPEDRSGLDYLQSFQDTHIFQIVNP